MTNKNFVLSAGKQREMNASMLTDVNDCSIMELDKTAIELDNSRIVASGNSKESQDTPMGDTEEC